MHSVLAHEMPESDEDSTCSERVKTGRVHVPRRRECDSVFSNLSKALATRQVDMSGEATSKTCKTGSARTHRTSTLR